MHMYNDSLVPYLNTLYFLFIHSINGLLMQRYLKLKMKYKEYFPLVVSIPISVLILR